MYAAAISDLRVALDVAEQSLRSAEGRGTPGDPDELRRSIEERKAAIALLERSEPKGN